MESLHSLETQLNQMRGRYGWENTQTAKDLIEKIDILRESPNGEYCIIIALEIDNPDEFVTYAGSFKQPNRYVKSFENGKVKYTYDEAEAKKFCYDVEGTKCMRQCIKDGATHILVWTYKDWELMVQCINYPNEHWKNNDNLQPILMHHTVKEYFENKY